MLLGVDIGTTHCKAGLFDRNGALIALAHCPTPSHQDADGAIVYDPDQLWATVANVIRETTAQAPAQIAAVGIASMAETGLLVDRRAGTPYTPLLPWFDRRPAAFVDQIKQAADRFERFCATGQYPNFKSALAKLLWLHENQALPGGALWLSVADYIAYRLTGAFATDYTLAARTFAFRLDRQTWDDDWLREWDFRADLFPQAQPSGTPSGAVRADCADQVGLVSGTPVAIAGHDHVCAAFAAGAIDPTRIFDSMGTAETLIGALPTRSLGHNEYAAGLTYGCHVDKDRLYWMGGLSAAGGSLEWLRSLLGDPPLEYAAIERLIDRAGPAPTGILYLPYLLGSGTPHPDQRVRGAFIGLSAGHTRAHLMKAVLEGTAYELEFSRRAAERGTGAPISTIIAAGGGTRNHHWMQIKADVGGCRFEVPAVAEATVFGAALVAGIGCGVYRDAAAALEQTRRPPTATFTPDQQRHAVYHRLYEDGYLPIQQPLRQIAERLDGAGAA